LRPAMLEPREVGVEAEDDLLLACMAAAIAPACDPVVQFAATVEVDVRKLLRSAERHRVVPLLDRGLGRVGSDAIPAACRTELRERHRAIVARNLQTTVAMDRLTRFLAEKRIRAIPYKGLAISLQAYGDASARQFGDVDILVRAADYPEASRALESLGMQVCADWGWERSFVDVERTVAVDLHRSITSPDFPVRFRFEELYRRRVPLATPTGEIESLVVEDALMVACIQVVKDGRARKCVLAKICDVAALLTNRPAMDWPAVLERSRRLGCRRIVGIGLSLADQLLAAPVPDVARRAFMDDPHVATVAAPIVRDLFVEPEHRDAEFDSRRYYFAARERWRDRVSPGVRRWLRRLLIPTERDRAVVRLPRALSFVYFAIRPLRLLRDRARRAIGGGAA